MVPDTPTGKVSPVRRPLIAVAALCVLGAAACGPSESRPSAAPPTVPGGPTTLGGDGVASASASANSIAPTFPVDDGGSGGGGDDDGDGGGAPARPQIGGGGGGGGGVPVTVPAPPPTYDPALQPYCDAVQLPVEEIAAGASGDGVLSLPLLIEPLQASLGLAPEPMVGPTERLIEVLGLLEGAIDSGEVTDKDSMVRWGLVNLSPEQITSLQTDLLTLNLFLSTNCPPR